MGLNPIARTLKVTSNGNYRSGLGYLEKETARPATWALKGKTTTRSTFPYKGGIEGTKTKTGGGLTRRGGAAVASGTGGGALALKTKKKVEKNMRDPFEINKAEKPAWRRPTFQNTRKENMKVGAAVGAGTWGGLAAASGAHIGSHDARRGIKTLRAVGAHPGKLRAAKIVAGHGAKSGAVLGAIGAASGAAVGGLANAAISPKGTKGAERDRKYAIQAAKMKADRLDRKAAKSRANAKSFSKSAFGIDHELEKAWKGTKGDKRNTKYYGAALGGSVIGRNAGMKISGTNEKTLRATARMHGTTAAMGGEGIGPMLRQLPKIHGVKQSAAGDLAGGIIGAGAYHAYRKKKGIAKSAFGVEH